jgi:antitoxin ParD1/3/4/toxin ParE1/3/4
MNAARGFVLHPGAAQDVIQIWEFIAEDSPLSAKRVREEILDGIRKLAAFPHQGHTRLDLTSRPLQMKNRSL